MTPEEFLKYIQESREYNETETKMPIQDSKPTDDIEVRSRSE